MLALGRYSSYYSSSVVLLSWFGVGAGFGEQGRASLTTMSTLHRLDLDIATICGSLAGKPIWGCYGLTDIGGEFEKIDIHHPTGT